VNFTLPLLYGSLVKSWAQNERDHNGTHAVAGAVSVVLANGSVDRLLWGIRVSSDGDPNSGVLQ